MAQSSGIAFNLQRFSFHDGTGIRTLVFMKRYSLCCRWYSNPEGLIGEIQIMDNSSKCIGCGACLKACPEGAVGAVDGKNNWDLMSPEKTNGLVTKSNATPMRSLRFCSPPEFFASFLVSYLLLNSGNKKI